MSKVWSVDEMVRDKAWLMHVETGTIGRAETFHGHGEFVSPTNGKPVEGPVMTFDTGDSFVVTGDALVPLTDVEVAVYEASVKMLTAMMQITMGLANAAGISPGAYLAIVGGAMQMQRRQAELAIQQMAERARAQRTEEVARG